MTNILRKIFAWRHPYKLSERSRIYEDVAEICGSTPDHVYYIAHGGKRKQFVDDNIVAELLSQGIISRS